MTSLQDAVVCQPGFAAVNGSTGSGSSSPTKLQHLRLHIDAAAALGNDSTANGQHSDPVASPGPSPSPSTPSTAKTKWNAILQRLHTNKAQLLNRKPSALSPRGAAVDLPPSPGLAEQQQQEHERQAPPREFSKWGTLRQRLREVKQAARMLATQPDRQQLQQLQQRHVTQDSDDSSTVMSGTCSAMEAKIEQLLAQPQLPPAVTAVAKAGGMTPAEGSTAADGASGAAAAAGGGPSTLNLIVRRFRSPSVQLLELLPNSTAAAPAATATAAAPAAASPAAIVEDTAAAAAAAATATGGGGPAGNVLAARKPSFAALRLNLAPTGTDAGTAAALAAAGCADGRSCCTGAALTRAASTGGAAAPAAPAAPDMHSAVAGLGMRRNSSALNLNLTVTVPSAAAAPRATGSPDAAAQSRANTISHSNNSTGGSASSGAAPLGTGVNTVGGSGSSGECRRRSFLDSISLALPGCEASATPAAAAADRSQCWNPAATAGRAGPGAAAGGVSASCSGAVGSQPAAWAGAAAAPAAATAPAVLGRAPAAAAAAAAAVATTAPESMLLMQLPPSRFPQHSSGGCSTAAAAAEAAPARTSIASAEAAPVNPRRTSRPAPRIFATFQLPAHLYSSQEDILNDADIKELLGRVEAACGSRREGHAAGTAAAGVPSAASPKVHWHVKESSSIMDRQRSSSSQKLTSRNGATAVTVDSSAGEAAAQSGRCGIHVHVDEDADGHLSVVISDMDQEPLLAGDTTAAAAAGVPAVPQPVFRSSLRSSINSQRQGEQQQQQQQPAAAGEAVSSSPRKRSSAAGAATGGLLSLVPATATTLEHEHTGSTNAAAALQARLSDTGVGMFSAGRRFSSMNDAGDTAAAAAALAAASRRSSITLRPTHSCHGGCSSEGGQDPAAAAAAAAPGGQVSTGCAQQQQQHKADLEAASHVKFASGMRRRSSNSNSNSSLAGTLFGAAAAQPAATVVPLTSAALAAAAAAEAAANEQQQQQQALTIVTASSSGQAVAPRKQQQQQQQQQHAAVQVSASVADASDAASSCCDGQSDLSALANPLAYADTLRQRMDKHLTATATAAAAAGDAVYEDGAVTPRSAARQLEEFIQGNKPLQQEAARLKLGLQQRQQKQQQQQQRQGVAAPAAAAAGLLPASAAGATGGLHITRVKGSSSMHFKAAGNSSSRPLAAATTAAGFGGALNATAPAAVARGPMLQAGFQQQQQQQHTGVGAAAAITAAASSTWNFTGRQAAAAVAGGGDGEPAYFNVDELKHDLERALREVG